MSEVPQIATGLGVLQLQPMLTLRLGPGHPQGSGKRSVNYTRLKLIFLFHLTQRIPHLAKAPSPCSHFAPRTTAATNRMHCLTTNTLQNQWQHTIGPTQMTRRPSRARRTPVHHRRPRFGRNSGKRVKCFPQALDIQNHGQDWQYAFPQVPKYSILFRSLVQGGPSRGQGGARRGNARKLPLTVEH